jgi:hypothetical protein
MRFSLMVETVGIAIENSARAAKIFNYSRTLKITHRHFVLGIALPLDRNQDSWLPLESRI